MPVIDRDRVENAPEVLILCRFESGKRFGSFRLSVEMTRSAALAALMSRVTSNRDAYSRDRVLSGRVGLGVRRMGLPVPLRPLRCLTAT
jgi:hypothetical protein